MEWALRTSTVGVCAALSLLALACQDATPPAPAPVTIRIATGLPGMTFRPLGEALAAAYRDVLPHLQFATVETAGSVDNVEYVESGKAELGLALADVAYMGFKGELGARTNHVRGLAVLHPSTIHVVLAPSSTITSLSDLRGKRVGIGPPGSGTAVTSSLLLRAHGVRLDDVEQNVMPFLLAIQALVAGRLDAVFVTAAAPVEAVRQATRAGSRLLDVSGLVADRMRVDYPFLQPTTIPAGTYPGQDRPVRTLKENVILICRQNLDDVVVRDLAASLFKVLPRLAADDDFLRLVDFRRAPATPIPLHPGAAWYYRERELSR